MKKYIILGLILGVASIIGFWVYRSENKITAENLKSAPTFSLGSSEYKKNLNDLLNIVNTQDPHVALQELALRMQTNEVVFQNCHIMAHSIGRAAYKRYQDFDTALKYQDTTCSDGYLHGVIEAKFNSIKDTQGATDELKTICSKYKYPDRCWHGIGHGLMFFTQNDLPTALSICNTYSLARASSRCYEGVFMENFLSDPDAHPTIYVDAKAPFKPCLNQEARYKGACYFYVPIYWLGLHNNDYGTAVQWCEGAENGYADECVRGVGSLAMKYNIDKPKYVESLCMKANPDDVSSCISGMASYYLTFTGLFSKANSMCAQLEPLNLKTCQAEVKRNIRLFQD